MKRPMHLAVALLLFPGLLPTPSAADEGEKAFLPENPDLVLWQKPGQAGLARNIDERRVVEEAYASLQERLQVSGYDVNFRVSDSRTVYKKHFDKTVWTDLVSLPEGRLLDVEITELTLNDWKVSKVHYKPTWTHKESSFDSTEKAQLFATSVADALREAGAEDANLWSTEAITSYRVTATFDNQKRIYRAAVLWQPAAAGVTMVFQDHIVQGVEDAVIETAPSTPFVTPDELRTAQEKAFPDLIPFFSETKIGGDSCIEYDGTTKSRPRIATLAGLNGHNTGQHNGSIKMWAVCSCTSNCIAGCSPHLSISNCNEFGDVSGLHCHKKARKITLAGDSGIETAKCHAGQGCFIKHCFLCICGGISIEVSVGAFGITFNSPSSSIIFDASLSDSETCACDAPPPTPIVVDLDRNGLRLTSLSDSVLFDIDADGALEEVSWTDGSERDALLALDVNGNGNIDDGSELFGNHTLLADGSVASNGFIALADYDQSSSGGNGDGIIDPNDSVYASLRLWLDSNHDGIADSGELSTLDEEGVLSLELDYRDTRARDRHGNLLRYSSRAWMEHRGASTVPAKTIDVIFLQAE